MIKKYFALSIITASMLVAGCSSDDDDDVDEEMEVVGGEEVDPPAVATPGVGGTAFDTIANSPDHGTLLAAINAAGLADTLDDPANTFTIFAPTDAAFTALDEDGDDMTPTTADLLGDVEGLTRVLSYHVLSGDVDSTTIGTAITDSGDAAAAMFPTILMDAGVAQELTFTTSTTSSFGIAVNATDIVDADLVAEADAAGRVHSIDGVLNPPMVAEGGGQGEGGEGEGEGGEGEGGEGGGTVTEGAGAVQAELETSGNFTGFVSAFTASQGGLQKLDLETDGDPWTVFAPTDAALAGADMVVLDHIAVGGALSAADLLAAGSFTSFNGNTYAVGGTEDALTVGGFAVTSVGGGASITYTIEGVLQ